MYFIHYDNPQQFQDREKKRQIYRFAAQKYRTFLRAKQNPVTFFHWRHKSPTPEPPVRTGGSSTDSPTSKHELKHKPDSPTPSQGHSSTAPQSKSGRRKRVKNRPQKAKRTSSRSSSIVARQQHAFRPTARLVVDGMGGGVREDPFSTVYDGRPLHVAKAIDYYVQVLTCRQCVLHGFVDSQRITPDNPMTKLFLPLILKDTLVMDFMVMYTLCFVVLSGEARDEHLYQALMYQRSRSITHIQNRLRSGQVDDMLIQGVNATLSTDAMLGNFEHVATHAKGMKALVAARGLSKLGDTHPLLAVTLKHQYNMIMTMLHLSIDDAATEFPDKVEHQDQSRLVALYLPSLSVGFQTLATNGKLALPSVMLIADFMQWNEEQDNLQAEGKGTVAWKPTIPENLSAFERCVILAVVCLSEDKLEAGAHFFHRRSVQTFDQFFDRYQDADQMITDSLIWVLSSLGTARNNRYISEEMRDAMLGKAFLRFDVMREWASFENLLRRYHYEAESAQQLHQLWYELQADYDNYSDAFDDESESSTNAFDTTPK